jgi:hypothetical protein
MYEDLQIAELKRIALALEARNSIAQQALDLQRLSWAIQSEQRDIMNQFLDLARQAFSLVNLPAGFKITEKAVIPQGGKKMAKAKATVDFVILDDGKGVLFTLQPVNAAGNPVPLPSGSGPITGVSSVPGSLTNPVQDPGDPTANPPRLADTTGLVFLSTVPQPPVDATGIVVTFSDTLTSGAVISTAANPVDVTADNTPAGFTISESVAS